MRSKLTAEDNSTLDNNNQTDNMKSDPVNKVIMSSLKTQATQVYVNGGYKENFLGRRKVVVVGDGECGKTSLPMVFCRDCFPELYIPTVLETHMSEIEVAGYKMELCLYDTAGQEDFERIRPLSYPDTDVVIVCFSVDNPDSFHNVTQTWVPEVRHFCTRTPILLVATKTDLRTDKDVLKKLSARNLEPITIEQGYALGAQIGAYAYVECSAKTRDGVQEVFQKAVRASLMSNRRRQKSKEKQCVII